MVSIEYIRNNREELEKVSKAKKIKLSINRLLEVDKERRELIKDIEELKNKRNKISKELGNKSFEDKEILIEEGKGIRDEISEKEPKLKTLETEYKDLMLRVPNIVLEGVPIGDSDKDNVEIRRYSKGKEFNFAMQDHLELGEKLNILDIKRGVKVGGTKSYYLKNEGAELELAVLNFAMDTVCSRGFSPYIVPHMVKREVMEGTGYFPIGEEQSYHIEKDKRYLIGTSEVPMASYYGGEILNYKDLPIRMAGLSSCYRREAGTYGKDKGLYRIHQFQKVEQVILGRNDVEESKSLHMELLTNAEDILIALDLPYRVVLSCTGDIGLGQVLKHDIEVWMPSRGGYGETHSCSSFYEFQARRLNIRYKDKDGSIKYVHTLNNTAIASPRILIPILENYQLKDGSVKIPNVLQKYMRGKKLIDKS